MGSSRRGLVGLLLLLVSGCHADPKWLFEVEEYQQCLEDPSDCKRLILNDHRPRIKYFIPTEIGTLTRLTYLAMAENRLSHPLPTELGNLHRLRDLYLEHNAITGYVPTELGRLTALTSLLVNDNELSGTLPSELSTMTALQVFTAFNNTGLCGSVPAGAPLSALQGGLYRDGTWGTRLDETCPYVQELPPLHELPYLNDINPITFERQGYDALPTGINWTQREDGKYVYRKTTTQVTVETTTTLQKVREHDYERRMPLLSTSLMRQRYEFARRMLMWNFDYTVVVSERWFPEENVAQQAIRAARSNLDMSNALDERLKSMAQNDTKIVWLSAVTGTHRLGSLALDLNVDGLDVSDIDGAMVKNFIEELAQEARRIAGPRRRIHIVYERSGALSRKSTLDRLHKLFDGMVLPLPDHSPDLNLCDLTVFPLFQDYAYRQEDHGNHVTRKSEIRRAVTRVWDQTTRLQIRRAAVKLHTNLQLVGSNQLLGSNFYRSTYEGRRPQFIASKKHIQK